MKRRTVPTVLPPLSLPPVVPSSLREEGGLVFARTRCALQYTWTLGAVHNSVPARKTPGFSPVGLRGCNLHEVVDRYADAFVSCSEADGASTLEKDEWCVCCRSCMTWVGGQGKANSRDLQET